MLGHRRFLLSQGCVVDNACRKPYISRHILWIIKIWKTTLFWARWNYNGKYKCNCPCNALGSSVANILRFLLFACIFISILSLDELSGNLLPKMLIIQLKLLVFLYDPFCAFWLYTVLPTRRLLLNYELSTKRHMLARYLCHSFSLLCFLCVLLKPLILPVCFLSSCNVALGITSQLLRSYQKNSPPTSASLWLSLANRLALILSSYHKMEYLGYRSVIWTGKLKRVCSCVMGEIGKTVIIRILFCPYCCRKCSWLFYSNTLYETPLETISSPQHQHCYLGVKINRSLLARIQFLCIALESGRARLCIRLSWVKVDWGLRVFHQNVKY